MHTLDPASVGTDRFGRRAVRWERSFIPQKSPLHPYDLASVCARRGGVCHALAIGLYVVK